MLKQFASIVVCSLALAGSFRSHEFLRGAGIRSGLVGERRCRGGRPGAHDAAIVYLVPSPDPNGRLNPIRAQTDWNATLLSLRSLTNFVDGNRAEVRIFLDDEDVFSDENIDELLAAASPRDACTVRVKFRSFPRGFDPDGATSPSQVRSKWGYEHMIRFFFSDLFMTDALAGLKYWMRMDTDSFFRTKVVMDPFATLDKHQRLAYLHNKENKDHGNVTEGLCDFVRAYVQDRGQEEPDSCTLSDGYVRGFFNNIEVGRVEAFQSHAASDFMEAVQVTQGIYKHRWGDALLRRIMIELLGLQAESLPAALLESYQHGHETS